MTSDKELVEGKSRAFEQACASELVDLLISCHRLPILATKIEVASNWKTTFEFRVISPFEIERKNRYGRGVGLEIHWDTCDGDVDAHQIDGDVVTALRHSGQILKKWFTREEERPSKLLARVRKDLHSA